MMEQSRKVTQTGSVTTQRTSTPSQNMRYSADSSTNFQTTKLTQGQSGNKTGRSDLQKSIRARYEDNRNLRSEKS